MVVTYLLHFEGDGEGRRIRAVFEDLGAFVEYLSTRGESGRVPEDFDTGDRIQVPEIREAVLARILDGRTPQQLQSEMVEKLNAAGIRVRFP